MAIKTNTTYNVNDVLEKELREVSINSKLRKFKEDNPNMDDNTIDKLREILSKQEYLNLEDAIEELEEK